MYFAKTVRKSMTNKWEHKKVMIMLKKVTPEKIIKVKVLVEFDMLNVCTKKDLVGEQNTIRKMVEFLIREEGLLSVVDENYKIVKVTEVK